MFSFAYVCVCSSCNVLHLIFYCRRETVLTFILDLTASMYQKSISSDTFRMIDRFRSRNYAFHNFRSHVSVYVLAGKTVCREESLPSCSQISQITGGTRCEVKQLSPYAFPSRTTFSR